MFTAATQISKILLIVNIFSRWSVHTMQFYTSPRTVYAHTSCVADIFFGARRGLTFKYSNMTKMTKKSAEMYQFCGSFRRCHKLVWVLFSVCCWFVDLWFTLWLNTYCRTQHYMDTGKQNALAIRSVTVCSTSIWITGVIDSSFAIRSSHTVRTVFL
jgi:hypothetical protein